MGLFDKLKGAMNAVTGNAAKVTFEYTPQTLVAGQTIQVKVTATSTGKEVKSKGCYVDLNGVEAVNLKKGPSTGLNDDISLSKNTYETEIQIAPEFVLAPNETKVFEGTVTVPNNLQPTFAGAFTTYGYNIRGRIEAFGNDPDSGFKPVKLTAH